jgi:hypothetical protein
MAMSYPEEREETLRSKVYKKYKYDIFPKIKHVRGTTRLKNIFEKMAQMNIEKINEDDIEPIAEKEWDNLIILDAARHDTYQETINTKSDSRITTESHSVGFIKENFSRGDWSDTVIITANPFYNESRFKKLTGRELNQTFETVFQVWDTDWNEEHGTVMPKELVEKTKTAEKLFPEKKKIIHFMQPHYPFINSELEQHGYGDAIQSRDNEKIWEKAEKEKIGHSEAIKDYKKNHKIMKDHIRDVKEVIKGKTIVTADHGNFLGENGLYGHPGKSKSKTLRKVPWDIIQKTD